MTPWPAKNPRSSVMDEYLGTREAAEIIGTNPSYVAQICRNGGLESELSDGEWRIKRRSAENYKLKKIKKRRPCVSRLKKADSSHAGEFWNFLKEAEPIIKKFGFEKFMECSEAIMIKKSPPESISRFWSSLGSRNQKDGKSPPRKKKRKNDSGDNECVDIIAEFQKSLF